MQQPVNANEQLPSSNLQGLQLSQEQLQPDQNSQILAQPQQILKKEIPIGVKIQSVDSSSQEKNASNTSEHDPIYTLLDKTEQNKSGSQTQIQICATIRKSDIDKGALFIEKFGDALKAFCEFADQHLDDNDMEVVLKEKAQERPKIFFELMDDILK